MGLGKISDTSSRHSVVNTVSMSSGSIIQCEAIASMSCLLTMGQRIDTLKNVGKYHRHS